jgi:hypothetical protein
MKRRFITVIAIITVSAVSLFTGLVIGHSQTVHTYQNVAIYNNGVLTDEDGEVFLKDFDILNNSTVLVTYDNNNTSFRTDDEPINVKVIDK